MQHLLIDRTVLKKLPTWKNERLVMFGKERVLQRKTCLHGYKGLVCCRLHCEPVQAFFL